MWIVTQSTKSLVNPNFIYIDGEHDKIKCEYCTLGIYNIDRARKILEDIQQKIKYGVEIYTMPDFLPPIGGL